MLHNRKSFRKKFETQEHITGLNFDKRLFVKRNLEINIIKEAKTRKFNIFLTEPQPLYLGHTIPFSSSGKNTASFLIELFLSKSLNIDNFKALAFDGANINIGFKMVSKNI